MYKTQTLITSMRIKHTSAFKSTVQCSNNYVTIFVMHLKATPKLEAKLYVHTNLLVYSLQQPLWPPIDPKVL